MNNIINNPSGLKCLFCKIDIPKRMSINRKSDGSLHKGMIQLCSKCGGAMILGDAGWRPMMKQDFDRLPQRSKVELMMTVKGLRQRLGTGQEWSPYEQPRRPDSN